MKRRVVVTGMGVVTPFGQGLEAFWSGLSGGRSAVKQISRFDAKNCPCRIAAESGEVRVFDWGMEDGWVSRMAKAAAEEAWENSQPCPSEVGAEREHFGLGLSLGWENRDVTSPDQNDCSRFSLVAGADDFQQRFGLSGPFLSCFSACAAGTQLLEESVRAIRRGEADVFMAGASDSRIHPMGLWGYTRLGALATDFNEDPQHASRPFDRKRCGFVMGEGAGFVVLEERERAVRRGAKIHAEILGAASTADACSITAPAEDGKAAACSILRCLGQANLAPQDLDYINAHGTSTPANDAAEARALEMALGAEALRVPVGGFKSMIGHLAMASGLVEIIGTILAMNRGILPPNINLEEPAFRLNFAGSRARELRLERVLKTSFGFGGQNSAVLLGLGQA